MKILISTPGGQVYLFPAQPYITVMYPVGIGFEAPTIPWDKLDDVEFLSELFGDCTVKMFVPIVAELGKMHAQRHLYKELISCVR